MHADIPLQLIKQKPLVFVACNIFVAELLAFLAVYRKFQVTDNNH